MKQDTYRKINVLLNDWYIVDCLTSSGKYFMHIQDENNFNNYQYRKGMEWDTTGQRFLTSVGKRESWVGTEI